MQVDGLSRVHADISRLQDLWDTNQQSFLDLLSRPADGSTNILAENFRARGEEMQKMVAFISAQFSVLLVDFQDRQPFMVCGRQWKVSDLEGTALPYGDL